jgi:putative phosphoesterase
MKLLIISDIHGNFDALSAMTETYDELWVLGDLVNYGPEPSAVVDFVKSKAAVAVRGNHDHAVGYGEDPRCSPLYREMAEATGRITDSVLTFGQKHFLRGLPLTLEIQRENTRFYLCHAIPSDPLFGYCEAESHRWIQELDNLPADVVLTGHTHVPVIRTIGNRTLVNPGSIGQPKTGRPDACYAVWEDGNIELRSYPYDVWKTVSKIRKLLIPVHVQDELAANLSTGEIPSPIG